MAHSARTETIERTVERWLEERSYRGSDFTLEGLLAAKSGRSVSAILPAREVAGTIGSILERTIPLKSAGLLDEIVVVDAASVDGTASLARDAGATVYQRDEILTDHGPSLGKGDALWRGLAVTSGDIVLFLDTDTQNFDGSFALGLLGPLLVDAELQLVKGAFERPLTLDGIGTEGEGGRVTELVARPLINLLFPWLAGFRQPLAGEIAARRDLLTSLPFPVGYGIEIAMLIDSLDAAGLDSLGQVDLGRRVDSSKPLKDLVPMAASVLNTALRRAEIDLDGWDGRLMTIASSGMTPRTVPTMERPPLASLDGSREGGGLRPPP